MYILCLKINICLIFKIIYVYVVNMCILYIICVCMYMYVNFEQNLMEKNKQQK